MTATPKIGVARYLRLVLGVVGLGVVGLVVVGMEDLLDGDVAPQHTTWQAPADPSSP
jgi:hypothetical protein